MARPSERARAMRAGNDRRPTRRRVCVFCAGSVDWIDYKDVAVLRRFINDRGRIRARAATGTCDQHQRDVAVAVKTAREVALLPNLQRTVSERGPGRGGPSPSPSVPAAPFPNQFPEEGV